MWTNVDRLLNALDQIGEPRILVVGDLMLDRFTQGVVERISPEAPALVLEHQTEAIVPGGAARVAVMLKALGARVRLAGVVGDDANGRVLLGLLDHACVDCQAVLVAGDRPTTTKQRFCAQAGSGQSAQLLRLDRESRESLLGVTARRLLDHVRAQLTECDAVLVADHDKGVCQPALLAELLVISGKPVLVDPARGVDLDRYRGAEALLPNRIEAGTVLDRDLACVEEGLAAAEELLVRSRAEAVLLKMDAEGLALAQRGQRVAHYPARARQVRDVAGAGDMVLATVGLCRAAHLGWDVAAGLAMTAAGLAVERPSTMLVCREELHLRLGRPDFSTADKPVTLEEMEALMEQYRDWGLSVALTNGCFDLLHAGHTAYLEEAAGLADVLVVAINSDHSVRRLKGASRPVVAEADRAALLAALQSVDHVLIFDQDTPHELLRRLRPDVLVKGGDYASDEVVGREVVQAYGGRVCVTARRGEHSSTALIASLSSGRGQYPCSPEKPRRAQ